MFSSVIVTSFLSSLYPKIPESPVEYELSLDQEIEILRNGKTIVKFYYTSSCTDCAEIKEYLMNLANQYKNHIYVENILAENKSYFTTIKFDEINKTITLVNQSLEKLPLIHLIGFNFTQTKIIPTTITIEENITNEKIFSEICKILFQPLADCLIT